MNKRIHFLTSDKVKIIVIIVMIFITSVVALLYYINNAHNKNKATGNFLISSADGSIIEFSHEKSQGFMSGRNVLEDVKRISNEIHNIDLIVVNKDETAYYDSFLKNNETIKISSISDASNPASKSYINPNSLYFYADMIDDDTECVAGYVYVLFMTENVMNK